MVRRAENYNQIRTTFGDGYGNSYGYGYGDGNGDGDDYEL